MARRIAPGLTGWQCCILFGMGLSLVGCASTPQPAAAPPPPTSATAGTTTIVAIAPPAAPPHQGSLGQFLGVPQIARGVGGVLHRIGSRLLTALDLTGRFPALQPKPPVLPLSDPANLQPTAPPAVQAAAEIKAEEDAAPQKIMAIRYLATLGCGGCYEKVEDALLEGLSDCTEEVRYEAVKALQCQPQSPCKFCNTASCCSAKVRRRLLELTTCEKEPSERIRRNARLTLACCGTVPLPAEEVPREGPPPPAAVLPPVTAQRGSDLFDGIQLVSFETLAGPELAHDPVLAQVNGTAVYRSQVLPLVEARLGELSAAPSDAAVVVAGGANAAVAGETLPASSPRSEDRERLLARELQRVIDWTLMEQFAKQDLYPAASAMAIPFSPQEIQAWFESRLKVDTHVTSQQLLAHYEVHRERFRVPTRVRWEASRVKLDRCSSPEQAASIAAYLRNRAVGGQQSPPDGFSREQVTAEVHEWMELDGVQPPLLRTTLAGLHSGQVSAVLELDDELVLLRVLERTPDEYLPLPVVADQLRSEILTERRLAAERQFMAHLRATSRITTVYDTGRPALQDD